MNMLPVNTSKITAEPEIIIKSSLITGWTSDVRTCLVKKIKEEGYDD